MTGKHRAALPEPVESQRGRASAIVGLVILVVAAMVVAFVLTNNKKPSTAASDTSSPRLELGASASSASEPSPLAATPSTPNATPSPVSMKVPMQFSAISVSVYNASGEKGLAAKIAQRLTVEGWRVRTVSGVNYRLPESTVFYDPQGRTAAEWMAAHDPTVHRAAPRPREFIPTGGLIVAVLAGAS